MASMQLRAQADSSADDIVAELYRVSPAEGRDLALRLPEWTRAQLAMFCNSRAHLQDVGRAIASVCSQESLVRVGGHAGRVLFEQRSDTSRAPAKAGARRITLSMGVGYVPTPAARGEDDAEE